MTPSIHTAKMFALHEDSRAGKQQRPAVSFRRDSNYIPVHGAPKVVFGSVDQPNQAPRSRRHDPAQLDLYSGGRPLHVEAYVAFGTVVVPEQPVERQPRQQHNRVPPGNACLSSSIVPTNPPERHTFDGANTARAGSPASVGPAPASNANARPPRPIQDQPSRPQHPPHGPGMDVPMSIPLPHPNMPHSMPPTPHSVPPGHQLPPQGMRLPPGPGVPPFSSPMQQYGRPMIPAARPTPGQPQGMIHTGYPYPFSPQHHQQAYALPRNGSRPPMGPQQPMQTAPGYSTSPGGTPQYMPQTGGMYGPAGVGYHHSMQPHFGQPHQYPTASSPASQSKSSGFVVPAKKSQIRISRPDTGETVDFKKVIVVQQQQQVSPAEQPSPQSPITPPALGGPRQSRALEIKKPPKADGNSSPSKSTAEEPDEPAAASSPAPASPIMATTPAAWVAKKVDEKKHEPVSTTREAKEPGIKQRDISPSRREPSSSGPQHSPSHREPTRSEPSPSRREPSPSRREPSPSRREPSPSRREPSPSRREPSPSRRESSPSRWEPSLPRREPSPSRQATMVAKSEGPEARDKSPVRTSPVALEPGKPTESKPTESKPTEPSTEFIVKQGTKPLGTTSPTKREGKAILAKREERSAEKHEAATDIDGAAAVEPEADRDDRKKVNVWKLRDARTAGENASEDAKSVEKAEELEDGEIRGETYTTSLPSPSKEKRPASGRKAAPANIDVARARSGNLKKPESSEGVSYPDSIKTLRTPSTNPGRFRYDRDFLIQFMNICKDKPEGLKPMDAIAGEDSGPPQMPLSARGKLPIGIPHASSGSSRISTTFGTGQMGSFQVPASKTSEQRFAESSRVLGSRSLPRASSSSNILPPGPMSGPPFGRPDDRRRGAPTSRVRDDRRTSSTVRIPPSPAPTGLTIPPNQIAPLEKTENRWVPKLVDANPNSGHIPQETLEKKVKGLLNKLTLEKFDRLAPQIMAYANRSENEKNGRSLRTVIRLIFEKATDEPAFSAMYARLCLTMQEKLSSDIIDLNVQKDNRPITGGNLFRKHLLNRCQEEFEKGWKVEGGDSEEKPKSSAPGSEILTDEYYAAQKKKRRGLGLIRFIGELFKSQMLTERIMHECVRRLLLDPEEEETESLCKLLTTVGKQLDCERARPLMDDYFRKMEGFTKLEELPSRIRYMVQDVIELRKSNWVPRMDASGPKTIAQIHRDAERQKQEQAAATAEALRKAQSSGGRGMPGIGKQIRRDSKDGWQVASKRVDTSNFGKFTKIGTRCLGPSGVFVGGKNLKADKKDESSPLSRTSSSNAFSLLQGESDHVTGRRAQAGEPERPKIQVAAKGASSIAAPAAPTKKSPAEEKKVADAMMKEFWAVHDVQVVVEIVREDIRNSDAHVGVIRGFVEPVLEKKEQDVEAVASVLSALADAMVTREQMRDAFIEAVPVLEDIVCDAPKAPSFFKRLIEAARLTADDVDAVLAVFSDDLVKADVA